MVALSTTAKRKKTADMDESPPKRVTRARAKATEETKSIAKTTKITTAAAKAAAENKVKTTKRKTRAEDELEQAEANSGPAPNPKAEPVKTRGRSRKIVEFVTAEGPVEKVPVEKAQTGTKTRQEKDVSIPGSAQLERPKMRARPKKNTLTATTEPQAVVAKDGKPENEMKSTRGRATTTISKATRTTAPKPSTIRKKVTFQVESEQDKENIPAAQEQKAKAGPKATGLRAKPVRKPAQPRTSSRGKGVTTGEVNQTGGKQETQPLSPKKVKQVAKTSSVSSEDELCGEKTPMRALSKSPSKPAMSGMRSSVKPMSKLDFSAATAPSSPTKSLSSSILTSPARRPPPSPFKDALKESPRRINLGESIVQPVLKPSQPTVKVSLLQSPARRPASSPTKAAAPSSPGKSAISVPIDDAETPTKQANPIRKPTSLSPQKLISSPLRAARSPEQSIKVHKMSLPEQEELAITTEPLLINESVVSKDPRDNTPQRSVAQNVPKSSTKTPKPELMLQSPPMSPTESADETEADVDIAAAAERHTDSVISTRSTTPSGPPPSSVVKAYNLSSPAWRSSSEDSESEDELQSPQKNNTPTPLSNFNISTKDFGIKGASTPSVPNKTPKSILRHTAANAEAPTSTKSKSRASQKPLVEMTPLAVQLSSWLAASPEKNTPADEVRRPRGIFSPIGPTLLSRPDQKSEDTPVMSPIKSTFFEDEMAVRDEQNEAESEDVFENDENRMDIQLSQESHDSEEYGDENAMPLDPELLGAEHKTQDFTLTCTPAKVFSKQPREIHTVSKVPLRPAAEDSPLKMPRKRSKSLSSDIAAGKSSQNATSARISHPGDGVTADTMLNELVADAYVTSSRLTLAAPQTPGSGVWSVAGTPARSNRRGADAEILKGAVVYVDVHTTEGADASGIFLELLTQMGARCVKQWTWNPRASYGGSLEDTGSGQPGSSDSTHESTTPGSKIGITHVVFKDGGKRTLEKVRESKGVVLCVGVGWVLDCERENKWLDEADYAVDTSTIPRGGHRRRKSMEPRLLSNINGSLIPAEPPAKQQPLDLSPTKEFLTFSSPASRRDSFAIVQQAVFPEAQPPQTPIAADDDCGFEESAWGSPTTPYYLSRGAELVQQTCPPKQLQQLLFPLSGEIEDQPDETVRRRLLLARRKSLQWAPKVGSPLGRAVSFGK